MVGPNKNPRDNPAWSRLWNRTSRGPIAIVVVAVGVGMRETAFKNTSRTHNPGTANLKRGKESPNAIREMRERSGNRSSETIVKLVKDDTRLESLSSID